MRDEKLREAIDEYMSERGETAVLLDNHAYDGSIVGITAGGSVVYDYSKMVEEFASDEGCSIEEATEWVDYNTMRAMPYANAYAGREGLNAPIIIEMGRDELLGL